jgi:hypothetical protein
MHKTGMLCPIPDFYVFIKHDELIQVEKFSKFLPAISCGNNALWELMTRRINRFNL